MDLHCKMIMEEYLENKPTFELMKEFVIKTLRDMFSDNGMLVVNVEGRVKEEKSLAGKLELKGSKYTDLSDITDILGARVITFYSSEVDKIGSMIEKTFEIDWENSVDKRKALATDQFGYMSLHYICRIPKSLYSVEEYPQINEYRFEIQMRTALQHVWATVYHDTGYKSNVEVPKVYIRQLSRLSGLLEIADEEFSSVINEINDYRRKVESLIKDGDFDDLTLDGDTYKSYIGIEPFAALNNKIAAINNAEIQETSFAPYYEALVKLGIHTLGDIERIKAKYSEDAYKLALIQIGDTDLDIVASTIGLKNLCFVYIIKNGGGEVELVTFLNNLNGERPSNKRTAKRIMELAEKLNF